MDWRNLVKPVDSAPAAYVTHATNVYLEYLNSAPTGIDYWERLANEKADMIWVKIDSHSFLNEVSIVLFEFSLSKDVIDGSRGFFKPICVKKEQRSRLNITFKCANGKTDSTLVTSDEADLLDEGFDT